MDFVIEDMIEEYDRRPVAILPTLYRRQPTGYVEPGYWTNVSAFLFPMRGEGVFALDGRSFSFRPGIVLHGCPGKWLTSRNCGDQPLEFYAMYYNYPDKSEGYMHRVFEMEIGINPVILSHLELLAQATGRPDSRSRFQAKALFYSVLSELFNTAARTMKNETQALMEDARAYIEFHYMKPHTLFDLAGRFGMSPKYFGEVFKKYAGLGPIDYVIEYRMKQAYRMLLSTNCTVKDIAQAVGYADAYYFSRLFKKQFNFAPSEVRSRPAEQAT
ncbi:HTH-type transcriptional activator Btr [compost metagenome]